METSISSPESLGRTQFKSYYVVWKQPHLDIVRVRECAFKSYYVVWKPSTLFSVQMIFSRFKSYYVVWKLFQYNVMFSPVKTFKSYYVVWKPYTACRLHFCSERLNRTMQYGNFCCMYLLFSFFSFKSYYVVWKQHNTK